MWFQQMRDMSGFAVKTSSLCSRQCSAAPRSKFGFRVTCQPKVTVVVVATSPRNSYFSLICQTTLVQTCRTCNLMGTTCLHKYPMNRFVERQNPPPVRRAKLRGDKETKAPKSTDTRIHHVLFHMVNINRTAKTGETEPWSPTNCHEDIVAGSEKMAEDGKDERGTRSHLLLFLSERKVRSLRDVEGGDSEQNSSPIGRVTYWLRGQRSEFFVCRREFRPTGEFPGTYVLGNTYVPYVQLVLMYDILCTYNWYICN